MTGDPFSVDGRVVVVTGGMGLLGREFTVALADRGARVAIFDLDVQPSVVAERFGDLPERERLLCLRVDVTDKASIEEGLRAVHDRWDVPWGLVNNAALDSPPDAYAEENGPFETYPQSSWANVLDVNTTGVFLCSQVVGGAMAAAQRGSIVNISSIYGIVSPDQRIYEYRRAGGSPFYKPVAYSVSKSAVLNLTRYLATYWASRNVRVNTLTLGGVFNEQDETFVKGYAARVPLGRMARQNEYNGAVIFLLSDASSYMTGANLVVDGGWTAW